MTLGILVIAMLVLLFLRVPVAISMLLPCLVYVAWSPDITLGVATSVGSVDSSSWPSPVYPDRLPEQRGAH